MIIIWFCLDDDDGGGGYDDDDDDAFFDIGPSWVCNKSEGWLSPELAPLVNKNTPFKVHYSAAGVNKSVPFLIQKS